MSCTEYACASGASYFVHSKALSPVNHHATVPREGDFSRSKALTALRPKVGRLVIYYRAPTLSSSDNDTIFLASLF